MRKKNKSFSGYIADVSAVVTLLGLFFMFASFIGTSMDIRTSFIIMLITVLSASIYIWTLKQEQRRAAKLQEIIKLSQLTQIDLSGKGLTRLSPELFHLTELTNLEVLNLSGNQLATLPPEFFELTNLTTLNLSGNKFTTLQPNILQLINLKDMNISGNQLTALPKEIFKLTSLIKLNLSNNQLTTLPLDILQLKDLTELDLSNNQFTTLPQEITQLTRLEKLHLKGCPLTSPPAEVAQQGIEAVRSHFASLKEDVQPLNEVKVLLVGDGAAGKTSLVKQLIGETFDVSEDITYGISIRGWQPESCGTPIKVNFWDFGGQEIMHATHQFFLSKRSLYILVLDGRRDERAEYWLRYIEAFGGDSPVLIVLNKQDINPLFDVNRPFLREKYSSIRGFFPTSCKHHLGIARLKEVLLDELAKVEMVGIRWPNSWFRVKQQIEHLNKPYISSNEYSSFCKEAGIVEESSQEVLLDFLHDLGVVVHFKDFILSDMHVLNPVWVTKAVYKIITAQEMAYSNGVLHLKQLEKILSQGYEDKLYYPTETHHYILHLMQKFELCYELNMESVLVPQLLPVVEPAFSFDYTSSLSLVLYYPNFLPPSVFPRFMVKVHKDIINDLRWRTGVVLEDTKSGTQAVVKADHDTRCINIWVQGERRRDYLHYIRYLLADINSSFEKLVVTERIPMPDDPYVTADYQTLLDCVQDGIERYRPDGAKRTYTVRELLGLVQPKNADELAVISDKMGLKSDEKESFMDTLASVVEIKVFPPFFAINLNEAFKRILAWQKQKRQQSRK